MTLPPQPAKWNRVGSPHARLFGTGELTRRTRCAIIVAHPADEIVGAGCLISKLVDVSILHVTDGVANKTDKRNEQAKRLRQQCLCALALASVPARKVFDLWVPEHRAANHLISLTRRITTFLQKSGADIVITHPYEGAHPDHDATSFATHSALRLLTENGLQPPVVFEMGLYPSKDLQTRVTGFLPTADGEITTLLLDDRSRELKQRMFACLQTQHSNVGLPAIDTEKFRRPPTYDFTLPPEPNKLYYENFARALSADEWQSLATRALGQLFTGNRGSSPYHQTPDQLSHSRMQGDWQFAPDPFSKQTR